MDFDGDGRPDLLSGSYWPGEMFVFRGGGDGTFLARETILDRHGKPLNAGDPWPAKDKPDSDSLATVPFAIDVDEDGDLDLLVGNIQGKVILIPNEGTAGKPAYDPSRKRALEAAGRTIRVPGGDSGPVAADWDGDGRWDLLVGCGDGSVLLYRNTGTARAPAFAAAHVLIAPAPNRAVPHDQTPARPGVRTKICVTDWNRDGLPDLLVGDYWQAGPAPLTLTPEQEAQRDRLKARETDLFTRRSELYRQASREGRAPESDPELQKTTAEMLEVMRELRVLVPGPTPRGSVWVYLRKPRPALSD